MERVSKHFVIPALRHALQALPFVVHGFHSDNGSEYVDHQVVTMLEKLRIEFTSKSRARRTNDNAVVESKKASEVRKHLS